MLTVDPFCGIHMSIVEPSGVFSVTGEVTHSRTLRGWLSLNRCLCLKAKYENEHLTPALPILLSQNAGETLPASFGILPLAIRAADKDSGKMHPLVGGRRCVLCPPPL